MRSELLASNLDLEEIRTYLQVDSLAYLGLDRLIAATGTPQSGFCTACFTGEYPVEIPSTLSKAVLEAPGAPTAAPNGIHAALASRVGGSQMGFDD